MKKKKLFIVFVLSIKRRHSIRVKNTHIHRTECVTIVYLFIREIICITKCSTETKSNHHSLLRWIFVFSCVFTENKNDYCENGMKRKIICAC